MSKSRRRAELRAWQVALFEDDTDALRTMLERGIDVDARCCQHGETPLMLACSVEALRLLLQHGASIEARDELYGRTPLMWHLMDAKRDRVLDLCGFLLQSGANPNAKDGEGKPALFYAVDSADIETVKLLLRHDADDCIEDDHGDTALLYAFNYGFKAMEELLWRVLARENIES